MSTFAFTAPTVLAVAVGAALGGLGRWGVSHLVHHSVGSGFPWGTLSVNVLGCLGIGVLSALVVVEDRRVPEWIHAGLVIGLLGGFTTFSTFGRETIELLREGRIVAAFAYVFASNLAGLAALWLGWSAVRGR